MLWADLRSAANAENIPLAAAASCQRRSLPWATAFREGAAMSIPYRSILIPIQFDDPSLLALGFAKRIAVCTVRHCTYCTSCRAIGEPDVSENEHTREEKKVRATLVEIFNRQLTAVKHKIRTAAASSRACQNRGAGGGGGQRGSYRGQDARAHRALAPDSRQRGRGNSADRSVLGADVVAVGSGKKAAHLRLPQSVVDA